MKHCGTQIIETERLLLRPFNINDSEGVFYNWASDPNVQNEYGELSYTEIIQIS